MYVALSQLMGALHREYTSRRVAELMKISSRMTNSASLISIFYSCYKLLAYSSY